MTIKTLPWCPVPGYTVENEPRRKVTQFGDGYSQRVVDGLNPLLRKYNMTYKLNHKSAVELDRFFIEHCGIKAFLFREYENSDLIKAVCPKWSKTVTKRHTEISCTFEEVV